MHPGRTPLAGKELDDFIKEVEPLRRAFELLGDHVVITDANAHILYANAATEKHTGFSAAEIIGMNPGDLWGGHAPKDFYEKLWRTIKTDKQPFVGEIRNQRKDGTWYWQELHVAPILDGNGDVKFYIGIEPEITERKELEAFRAEFISMFGHQLKTPVTAIRWTLEMLLGRSNLDQETRETLQGIYAESQDMTDLIHALLVQARLEQGGAEPEPFDLGEEIEKKIALVKTRNPHVTFSFKKTGSDFGVTSKKTLALEIMTNILSNAAEYSAPGAGKVSVLLKRQGNHDLFSCENNGTVIPKEDQPNIFTKFFRASNASEIKEAGTGLGLYLVKMLSDKLGWDVSFKSPAQPDGNGTIFFLKIPR